MMFVEELLSKVHGGGDNFIGEFVDISSRSIFTVGFKGFRFNKIYKRFGVKKVKKGIFNVIKSII